MAEGRDINGVGVGVIAFGVVLGYAGFFNVPLLEAFKALAMGQKPTPHPKTPFSGVTLIPAGQASPSPLATGGGNSQVLAVGQQVAASAAGRANYCWGGGHTSSPCSARCFDCSGFVSCVLNRMGLLKGSMTTTGFLAWSGATTIGYDQRQPGDLLVNTGHMGIVADDRQMLNAACTACGPVKLSDYTGRRYTVRRVKATGSSGGSSGSPRRAGPGTVVPI